MAEDLNSLARCVELLGIGCLTEQSMPELVQIILSTLTQHFERQQERNQKRKDEDYDEGVEDQVLYLVIFIPNIISCIQSFFPHFCSQLYSHDKFLPHLAR